MKNYYKNIVIIKEMEDSVIYSLVKKRQKDLICGYCYTQRKFGAFLTWKSQKGFSGQKAFSGKKHLCFFDLACGRNIRKIWKNKLWVYFTIDSQPMIIFQSYYDVSEFIIGDNISFDVYQITYCSDDEKDWMKLCYVKGNIRLCKTQLCKNDEYENTFSYSSSLINNYLRYFICGGDYNMTEEKKNI